jgi:hypothetical protein
MWTLFNDTFQKRNQTAEYHLFIWASDGLIYHKINGQSILPSVNHVIKFRLFNEDEEFYGYVAQNKPQIRHKKEQEDQLFLQKSVKIKSNISQIIAAVKPMDNEQKSADLMLISRDYLAFKPNGQAYYDDCRMVSIKPLKLIEK